MCDGVLEGLQGDEVLNHSQEAVSLSVGESRVGHVVVRVVHRDADGLGGLQSVNVEDIVHVVQQHPVSLLNCVSGGVIGANAFNVSGKT